MEPFRAPVILKMNLRPQKCNIFHICSCSPKDPQKGSGEADAGEGIGMGWGGGGGDSFD